MTAAPSIADLKAEYRRLRERDAAEGRWSFEELAAYERWFHESCAAGRPPDALSRYVADETERFFAQTIPGSDGHVYWDGPGRFRRNDGAERRPARWWWEHEHGPLSRYADLSATCDEQNCIAPEHRATGRSPSRQRFSDAQMLGAVQVAAMRLGRTPTQTEYREMDINPVLEAIRQRFGSWPNAVSAAGLSPVVPGTVSGITPETCAQSVRYVAGRVRRRPTKHDLTAHAAELHARGLPSSGWTVSKYLGGGSWVRALERVFGEAA